MLKYRIAFILVLLFLVSPTLFSLGGSNNLVASLAQIPGLADSPTEGTFIELVKAIENIYKNGTITIGVFPFARSVYYVIEGRANFQIPTIRNPSVDPATLPYGTADVPMGRVAFVIYSNVARPISKKMLDDAIASPTKFPYSIDIAAGIESQYPFPGNSTNVVISSLYKLAAGRIDGLVWAQEEVDGTIKILRLKNIRREFWEYFDDAIIIPKGAEGDGVNEILSDALTILKNSSRLEALHSKVHHSFDAWQPSEMGW
jgi:polar amino acid transport system substrate-binding protein